MLERAIDASLIRIDFRIPLDRHSACEHVLCKIWIPYQESDWCTGCAVTGASCRWRCTAASWTSECLWFLCCRWGYCHSAYRSEGCLPPKKTEKTEGICMNGFNYCSNVTLRFKHTSSSDKCKCFFFFKRLYDVYEGLQWLRLRSFHLRNFTCWAGKLTFTFLWFIHFSPVMS